MQSMWVSTTDCFQRDAELGLCGGICRFVNESPLNFVLSYIKFGVVGRAIGGWKGKNGKKGDSDGILDADGSLVFRVISHTNLHKIILSKY